MGEKANITFSELMQQKDHEPIWVLNTTKGAERGNVFFSVHGPNGREESVNVFVTWAPVCLTEEVTRTQLLASNNFRRAVNVGKLRLISDAEAQQILTAPDAVEEMERYRQLSVGSASAETQFGLGRETEVAESNDNDGISNPVRQFIDLMSSNSDSESLNTLRTMGELARAEFIEVMRGAKKLGYPLTGKYASSEAQKLRPKKGDDDSYEA